MALAHT